MFNKNSIYISIFFIITMCFNVQSKIIYRSNFKTEGLKGWITKTVNRGTSLPGEIKVSNEAEKSIWLHTPEVGSWGFIIKRFDLQDYVGKTIKISARVLTNNPKKALFLISCGHNIWGGSNLDVSKTNAKDKDTWSIISVTKKIPPKGSSISVALGFDYSSAQSWMLANEIVVEELDTSSSANTIPVLANKKLPEIVPYYTILKTGSKYLENLKASEKTFKLWLENSNSTTYTKNKLNKILHDIRFYKNSLEKVFRAKKGIKLALWNKIVKFDNKQKTYKLLAWGNESLELFNTSLYPAELKPLNRITLNAAIGESEGFILFLRNNSPESIYVKLKAVSKKPSIQFRSMIPVDMAPDAMPLLGKMEVTKLASYETVGVWCSVKTDKLQPGDYSSSIQIIPLDSSIPKQSFSMSLKVHSLKLPAQLPVNVFSFDYSAANSIPRLKYLLNSRVNTFHIHRLPKPDKIMDFSVIELPIKNVQNNIKGKFTIIFETWFMRKNTWHPEYATWLQELVKKTKELGLGYSDWYLHIFDESFSDDFYNMAKSIKNVDPKIRIFSDHLAKPKIIEKFSNVVDAWCPRSNQIPLYPKGFELMQKSTLPVWTYECDSQPFNSSTYYRLLPWLAFKYKLSGIAYWTANTCSLRRAEGSSSNFGMNYHTINGNYIPSRRWLAWKDGLEDYLILSAAKKLNKDKLLKQAIDNVCNAKQDKILEQISKWRVKLLKAISSN